MAMRRPLIALEYGWREGQAKDTPFRLTNAGDDEARHVQIQPLAVLNHSFTFNEIGQLLPGRTLDCEPIPDDTIGPLFRTLPDVLEIGVNEHSAELKRSIPAGGTNLERFEQVINAEVTATRALSVIPVSVRFMTRDGDAVVLEYRLCATIFAKPTRLELKFVHEASMANRPNPFPPLRAAAEDALRVLEDRKKEGAQLFANDVRFTTDMQDRFFQWLKATGGDLKKLFWAEDVSNWFHTGTMWMANGFGGLRETRDDRLNLLDDISVQILSDSQPRDAKTVETKYTYDVCLSFAGEQRDYVEGVAEALRNAGVTVFYDGYEEVNLWGKNLYTHLNTVYRELSKYCVVFVSHEYATKQWTSHERESAQARAVSERREYLLPVRFDDTPLPGLNETTKYLDLRRLSPEQLAQKILEKIRA